MTRSSITRRRLGGAAIAGATLIGAPMPLRFANAQAPAILKVGLLLPTSGIQAQIGQACRRGADVANDVFADMKLAARLDIVNYDTESKPDMARTQAEKALEAGCHMPGRRLRLRTDARHRAGDRAARRAAGRQHRGGAADHRAGLQVPRPQLPDRRRC